MRVRVMAGNQQRLDAVTLGVPPFSSFFHIAGQLLEVLKTSNAFSKHCLSDSAILVTKHWLLEFCCFTVSITPERGT
jgi:hypothetical protein